MKMTLRAGLSVALLLGLYVLAAGVVCALVLLAYVAFRFGHGGGFKVGVLALVAAFAVIRGLVSVRRRTDDGPEGVDVGRHHEPELWQTVDELAATVATRAPDRILLVPEVNAAVMEDSRALGLVAGRRTLLLGMPLLLTLTRGQLRAVLCHELGHYSGSHTRLAPLAYRGHVALRRLVASVQDRPILRGIFVGYAKVYFRVSSAVSRGQELEADEAAVRVAGRIAMATALCEVEVQSSLWDFYLEEYVRFAVSSGRRPTDLFEGYHYLVNDPQRQQQLAELRANLPAGQPSPYDTHPSLAQRLAAVERLPDSAAMPDDRPAITLLHQPETAAVAAGNLLFTFGTPAGTWPELMAAAADANERHAAVALAGAASRLRGTSGSSLEDVLQLLEAGRSHELAQQIGREGDVSAVEATLAAMVGVALVEAGAARWQASWSDLYELVDVDGAEIPLKAPVWAAVATPAESVPYLRDELRRAGVDLDGPLAAPEPTGEVAVLGLLPQVQVGKGLADLLVAGTGILVVPIPHWRRTRFLDALGANPRRRRLERQFAGKSYAEILTLPEARLLEVDGIVRAELGTRWAKWTLTLDHIDGSQTKLAAADSGIPAEAAADIFGECLGERLVL